uniref:Metalloendopeptidase n=1 Tax=Strongyloides papillosus TaxID=174720 RepID=A0A0N5BPV1_STREA
MRDIFLICLIILLCSLQNTIKGESFSKHKKTKWHKKISPYPIKPEFIKFYISKDIDSVRIYNQLFYLNHTSCLGFKEQNSRIKSIGINFLFSKKYSKVVLSTNSKKPTDVYLKKSVLNNTRQLSYYVGLALGLSPEIQRYDRDKNVKILWKNIHRSFKKYYKRKKYIDKFSANTSFDFSSVMLINSYYGSKNKGRTYVSKLYPYYEKLFSQFEFFSHNDLKRINYLYCKDECEKTHKCDHGGYHEQSCFVCKCPYRLMDENVQRNLWASRSEKKLLVKNFAGMCHFSIKSKKGKKIRITVSELKLSRVNLCAHDIELEIKYSRDKGAVGLRLCDNYKNIKIPAQSSEIFVTFGDSKPNNKLSISYQEVN